jgi:serine/threonine protein kinase
MGGAPIVDFGCLRDGTCYLIMEPCSGVSLASLLTQGALPLPRALAVTNALAHILDAAHGQGFVYADLCAAEVFLRSDPPMGTSVVDGLCLIDWGGVYALGDSPRWPADEADLPRCRPPEAVAGGPVTVQADQYQLAALTLEMLTGPVADVALSARSLPRALHLMLARALNPRPEERFASIREFAVALSRALPLTLTELPGTGNDPPLRYCPLCGNASVDTEGYGSSGSGRCTHCGTIFTVLASPVRLPKL